MDFLATFFDNYGMLLAQGTWDTLLMTIVSTFFAYVIGIPLGVLCVLTSPKGLMPHRIKDRAGLRAIFRRTLSKNTSDRG